MKFTIYLFKETVKSSEDAFSAGKLVGENSYQKLAPKTQLPYFCEAYLQRNNESIPSWTASAAEYFQLGDLKIRNISNSFVLLIKVSERLFALTHGYGHMALNKNRLERDFGLKVVLNEINPSAFRSVVSRNIDTSTKQTQVATNRDSNIYDFKFQLDSDLLRTVSGLPLDKDLGVMISGSDSLTIQSKLDLPKLGGICEKLLESFNKDTYKERFPFIDQRREVKEEGLLSELNLLLDEKFSKHDTDSIFFANPELREIEEIAYYKLGLDKNVIILDSIDSETVLSELMKHITPSINTREVSVFTFNSNDEQVGQKATLFDYVVFETEHKKRKYVLILGQWYEIDKTFYDQVDRFVRNIEDNTDPLFLPAMNPKEEEKDYNARVAKLNSYLCLDRKDFPLTGHDQVEVADLLTPDLDFICVKKHTRSSTLSHLFNQGTVSAKLHSRVPEYRDFICKKIAISGVHINYTNEVKNSEIRYIYAIATNKKGGIADSLPFFSKVNLMQATNIMRELGCNVSVAKIEQL